MIFCNKGAVFFVLTAFLFVVGCTTEPAVKKNRIQVGSILLLPVSSTHEELLVGGGYILDALEKKLKSDDFEVFQIPPDQVLAFEERALELSGSVYAPKIKKSMPLDKSKYNYHLISLIASQYDFDVIAMPQLWLRPTHINVDEAQWDGVSREIEFINKPEKTYKLPKSARGVSLRLSIFSSKGGKIDTSFGGMSLPFRIDYKDGKAGYDLKEEFYSHREVKEAVEIVLNQLRADIRAK